MHARKEYGVLCDLSAHPDVVGLVAPEQVCSARPHQPLQQPRAAPTTQNEYLQRNRAHASLGSTLIPCERYMKGCDLGQPNIVSIRVSR